MSGTAERWIVGAVRAGLVTGVTALIGLVWQSSRDISAVTAKVDALNATVGTNYAGLERRVERVEDRLANVPRESTHDR